MKKPVYKRVLLKLGGESLQGKSGYGIDPAEAKHAAGQVKQVWKLGVEIAIVIGGDKLLQQLIRKTEKVLDKDKGPVLKLKCNGKH